MAEIVFGNMPTEAEYPMLMIHAAYLDGTTRRVVGEVCTAEDFLVMCQSVSSGKLLPANVNLALVKHDGEDL